MYLSTYEYLGVGIALSSTQKHQVYLLNLNRVLNHVNPGFNTGNVTKQMFYLEILL